MLEGGKKHFLIRTSLIISSRSIELLVAKSKLSFGSIPKVSSKSIEPGNW